MLRQERTSRSRGVSAIAAAVATCFMLAACGHKSDGPSQVAAKVNDDEITVHQINLALQQQRGITPDQVPTASKQLLDKLIDQQLAVQQAEKLKLDQDPLTVQMIDAARREILANRYVQSVADTAGKPSADDEHKYFEAHPGLFSNRKIYTFSRVDVQVPPAQMADVEAHSQSAKSTAEFTDWLKSQSLKFNATQTTQPAEALPLPLVEKVATMNPGQALDIRQPFGVSVLTVISSQPAPKTFDESRAAIEQFLSVELRRTAVESATRSLKQQAKIEYVGTFAASAPAPGGSASAADVAPVPASDASPASAPQAAATPPSAISNDAESLHKGLGLK